MKQTPLTGPGTRRPLRVAVLAVLTALLAVLVSVAVPSAASAAGSYDGRSGYDNDGWNGGYNGGYDGGWNGGYDNSTDLVPLLNCVQVNSNGSYTAVLGYRNSTRNTTYGISGTNNQISPSQYNGKQPTTFKPGTYNGVFSLSVSSGTVYWTLAGTKLTISKTAAAACPKDTQMPADGNGTGAVAALGVAAVAGTLIVKRARRRATDQTQESVHA